MKHAIILTVHDNIPVLKTAMEMLDDERFSFYLIADSKSKIPPTDFVPKLKNAAVKLFPSVQINWGAYSIIKCLLLMTEAALKDGNQYIHYLTGADMPLKTPHEIDAFFKGNRIFVDIYSQPRDFAEYKVLCKHWFTEFKSFRTNRFLKILNHGLASLQKPFIKFKKLHGKIYNGSAMWSIPQDFAQYLMDNKKDIQKTYKRSLAGDEVFIQTVLMDSPFKDRLSKYGNARYIDWQNSEGNSPKTFTMKDSQEILQAINNPNVMFVRKISANRDFEIAQFIKNNVGQSGAETDLT